MLTEVFYQGGDDDFFLSADGLISVPENDEDRPPTPPPLSTLPRGPGFLKSNIHQSVPGGHRWRSPMHMSCGNLATDAVFGSIALGPRSNFVTPQQHLVQKPVIRHRLVSDAGQGFQVRPGINHSTSLQGHVSSRESLVHDPWNQEVIDHPIFSFLRESHFLVLIYLSR